MTPEPETTEHAKQLAKKTRELAQNLWWTWDPGAQDLFRTLSAKTWKDSHHNAVKVIHELSREELEILYHDSVLREKAAGVMRDFEDYMNPVKTWGSIHCPRLNDAPVAYFSAEFGLHESLPFYSGGLGILSGDHIKSASDLGVPFVGITLFYRQSFFTQVIDDTNMQNEVYPLLHPEDLPMELVRDADGNEIVCSLQIAHSEVHFHAWRIDIGRTPLYMLDTNRPENDVRWREITSRVYGGDNTMRICQELVLGVGGVRLLRTLGICPSVYHLNEGHSSFLLLELLREKLLAGQSVLEARESVRSHAVFTTHTPVAVGHDRFTRDLLDHFLHQWPGHLNMSIEEFMNLGRVHEGDADEAFCMTVLALKLTRAANAVSELNGQVCREMWHSLYQDRPVDQVPIGHVTNGIHMKGWMTQTTFDFWNRVLGPDWWTHLMHTDYWEKISDTDIVSDEAIWALRYQLKRNMIEALMSLLEAQHIRMGIPMPVQSNRILRPDVLTIGFSRRFATYKRANLIFRDIKLAAKLFNSPNKPLQIVFSGKAHPRDEEGKHLIREIIGITSDPQFLGKVIFLEDYNIEIGRHLISGCDVWLNNPRRPLEACGTSGQKVAIHAGLNASILDGWWREGYDGTNGYAIGGDSHPDTRDEQDRIDSENLYHVIMNDMIHDFYDRDEMNMPRKWIQRIRRAMITLIPAFNTDRMVAEYTRKYYLDQQE